MNGHLLALTQVELVSRELVGHLLNTEASPVESACLSVLREDEVSGIESGCSSDARSFFSKLLHVERDSALALGCVVDLVDFVHGDHGIVHLEQVFVGDGSVIAFLDDVAFCVHDTEALCSLRQFGQRQVLFSVAALRLVPRWPIFRQF